MNSAGKSSVTAQYHRSSWAITVHETGDTMYLITRAQLFLRWSHNVAQFSYFSDGRTMLHNSNFCFRV